jgi:hypothetical protein
MNMLKTELQRSNDFSALLNPIGYQSGEVGDFNPGAIEKTMEAFHAFVNSNDGIAPIGEFTPFWGDESRNANLGAIYLDTYDAFIRVLVEAGTMKEPLPNWKKINWTRDKKDRVSSGIGAAMGLIVGTTMSMMTAGAGAAAAAPLAGMIGAGSKVVSGLWEKLGAYIGTAWNSASQCMTEVFVATAPVRGYMSEIAKITGLPGLDAFKAGDKLTGLLNETSKKWEDAQKTILSFKPPVTWPGMPTPGKPITFKF